MPRIPGIAGGQTANAALEVTRQREERKRRKSDERAERARLIADITSDAIDKVITLGGGIAANQRAQEQEQGRTSRFREQVKAQREIEDLRQKGLDRRQQRSLSQTRQPTRRFQSSKVLDSIHASEVGDALDLPPGDIRDEAIQRANERHVERLLQVSNKQTPPAITGAPALPTRARAATPDSTGPTRRPRTRRSAATHPRRAPRSPPP